MRGERVASVLLLLTVAPVALLSCSGDGRARGEPIVIAFAGPTSGPSAEDGLSAVRAIELVLERSNATGGVGGRPLELRVFDDKNDAALAREVAAKVAGESGAVAVIGHNTSVCSIAAGEVYAERGVPAIATAATNVDVTRDNDWYFRVIFDDRAQGIFVEAYVREVLGAERFGLVHETAAYGGFLADVMEEASAELGVALERFSFDPADERLEARLDRIVAEVTAPGAPRVLVLAMQPQAGVPFVKRLRERRYRGDVVVTDALASQAFADGFRDLPEERGDSGFYTDGLYAVTPFLFDAGGRRAATFFSEYANAHDRAPDWYAAFAADAATAIVETLRRNEMSPKPATLEADRAALRDALVAIDRHDAVAGITGPTFFDRDGTAEKPVPMGRFLNREILSAFEQLRLVPGVQRLADLDPRFQPERAVAIAGEVYYRTDVARVGVRARRFGDLDFDRGVFEMEFDLWFRHRGDREVERIQFTNAVEPVSLGEPVDELVRDGLEYRVYHAGGLFRADTMDADYGGHVLSIAFRHRERTRDDLVLALDTVGMNLGRASTRAQRGAPARRLLAHGTPWALTDVFFFENEVDEPALGHPSFLAGASGARPFSQLTIGVKLRRKAVSLRGLVPASYQKGLLAASLLASAILLFVGRGSSRARFVLQAVLALLVLISAEPVVGNWLYDRAGFAGAARVERVFDLLWWLVPAFLVTVAIERFLWRRAEEKTGTPIPTLLRYTVGFLVYLVAIFGIIAFVYDYRLTGLLATSGVLAMVIGLAVQLNITNIFAGVALNMERPFRVGDWIMIHGRMPDPDASVIGQVTDISWRTTRLRTADDTEIVIPNGVISEKTITNFNAPGELSRFQLKFAVDQTVPPDDVMSVIQAAMKEISGTEKGPVADPPPKVRIHEASETGIVYVVRYRLLPSKVSPLTARHTINESVLRHLREAGIELAVPRRRVYETEVPRDTA